MVVTLTAQSHPRCCPHSTWTGRSSALGRVSRELRTELVERCSVRAGREWAARRQPCHHHLEQLGGKREANGASVQNGGPGACGWKGDKGVTTAQLVRER